MKVAYVIFARDKAHNAEHVERCVRAAFVQTYGPLEIVLSDQGSIDGTRELLHRLAGEYEGPHTVRLLDCPNTGPKGMAGLNAHLAWLHAELDAEILVPAAADDDARPDRTAKLVEAFKRTGADMVGAAMHFKNPGAPGPHSRSAYAQEGWVSVQACVEQKVGGSAAPAWRRDLWARLGPINEICGVDVWMPPLACVLGGFYYLNEPLYTYYHHADGGNTGLEGALLAAKDEAAKRVIDEHRFFQTAAAWQWVLRRMVSLGVGTKEDRHWVQQSIAAHYEAWGDTRMTMTLNREPPQPFRI